MSSKEELYKLLVDKAPYGTLFFAYGVCIDANPRVLSILGCDKKQLVGDSLDEITGDESTALVGLKLQLKKAIRENLEEVSWQCPHGNEKRNIDINIIYVGENSKELIVTLLPQVTGESQPEATEETDVSQTEEVDSSLAEKGASSPAKKTAPAAEAPESETPATAVEESTDTVDDPAVDEVATESAPQPHAPEEAPAPPVCEEAPEPPVLTESIKVEPQPAQPMARNYYFDSLTNLPNRQRLLQSINNFLTVRRGEALCGALLMLDLDNFKDINDSWGHSVGDQVIKKVGRSVAGLVSGDNMLARMSGDEFVMFIPDISDSISQAAWDAQAVAERVREVVAAPIFLDGHEVILTASIGIALLTDSSLTAERALQYADTAMYEAKRKGRNSIAFFDPCITEKAQRQIGLNTRLRKAIDNQEFALYIQPQICVDSGGLQGGEALLRWINADKVTNMPTEFIPVLESSGLIVDVGHWVIRTACEYIRNLIDDGLWKDHMRLGINISPRQFRDPQLLEVVEHSLSSYGINPCFLDFEITENMVIEDVDETIRKMRSIKKLGSTFSIDDFGIGYSSMIYLKRLPFDHLKIDREFVRNISRDSESLGVVEAIMAVSRQYGLNVMAEGVESREALDVLRKVGCNAYQGAHYSMPVPFDRFKKMLAA